MKYDIGTIITLDNLDKYIIFSSAFNNNLNYYYVVGYDEEKEDINGTCKIIKIQNDGKEDYVELVDNKKELADIIPLFEEFYE